MANWKWIPVVFVIVLFFLPLVAILFVKNLFDVLTNVWIIALMGGGFLVVFSMFMIKLGGNPKHWVLASKFGALLIAMSVILLVGNTLLPYFSKPQVEFEECGELNITDATGILDLYSCVFFGLKPAPQFAQGFWGSYATFLFSGSLPLLFFWFAFWDTLSSIDFPKNKSAKFVFSIIGGLTVMRAFLSTNVISYFIYGWVGLASFYLALLFVGGMWSLLGSFYKGVLEADLVKDLLDVLSGRKRVGLKKFLTLIRDLGYGATQGRQNEIVNFIRNVYAADHIATQVESAYTAAGRVGRGSRGQTFRREMNLIIGSLS